MARSADVSAEVAALNGLSRDDLVERWRKIYGTSPPKGVRQALMIKAIAWHLQVKCLGGLSAETRRLLRSAMAKVENDMRARDQRSSPIASSAEINACDDESGDPIAVIAMSRQRRHLTPGARLIREWNGRIHTVDVIEGGYVFEAEIYPSLTAIAGKITGVHWSGPRFFGL